MGKNQLNILIFLACWLLPMAVDAQNLTDSQGRKTGHWIATYPNGTTRYEGTFNKGKPVGLMKRYNENGVLMAEMNFIPNTSRCYARLFGTGKQLKAEGLYSGQKKDSIWNYYRIDKSLSMKESYENGVLSGVTESYYPSGKISQAYTYKKGKKYGPWTQYFESGNIMQRCNYTNDMLNGHYEAFYPEGKLEVSGDYVRDMLDGDWKYFDEEGELKQVLEYVMGEIQNPGSLQENYDDFIQHVEDNIGNIPDPANGGY